MSATIDFIWLTFRMSHATNSTRRAKRALDVNSRCALDGGSSLRKKDVRSMEIIVRHFAKLERLERQWVIDRLHDDHFHKLPANLPPYLLRSNVTSQPTTGERKH